VKVRTFINTFNPKDILSGKIRFKLITNDGYGDKWLFWYDKENHKGKEIKTIDDFLNDSCDGINKAVNSYIDFREYIPIEVVICDNDDCDYDILYRIYYTQKGDSE